ncbi:MAG: hypothetical protein R2771_12820 [Saprospiraceae bacterium]
MITGSQNSSEGCDDSIWDNNNNNATNYTISFTIVAGALPLSLVSFTAQKQNNIIALNWAINNETNNSNYEIQRSSDAQHFETLDILVAKWKPPVPMNGWTIHL